MPWFLFVALIGITVGLLLLAPKTKVENARASSLDDLNVPRAEEGAPVPLSLGLTLMKGPNTIWVGDFFPDPIIEKQKTGLFSSKKVTIGYTYYIGLDLALSLGVCALRRIWIDKDLVWEGRAAVDGQRISINKPDLFGGKKLGGGFIGDLTYYTGSRTQQPDGYVESFVGAGKLPAYRGTAHIVMNHCNIGESNQLRVMSFELERYTNDLELPAEQALIGDDLNPMEVLYQVFTLPYGGLDVDGAILDIDAVEKCAATLASEGNGMSLSISKANSGKDVASEIIRQIDGLLYEDPQRGVIVPVLIRNDYNVADLPVLDESNIVSVSDYTAKTWEETINQVRVTYTNRENKYADAVTMVQDLANINAQGRIRSTSVSFPGVTNGTLATAKATTELSQMSVPLLSCSLEINRDAANLRPGSVFVWKWKAYNIDSIIMRVQDFDLGSLEDGRVVLAVVQDEFAVAKTVFSSPANSQLGSSIPSRDPVVANPSTVRNVYEAPYFFAQASGAGQVPPSTSVLLIAAQKPTNGVSFDVYVSDDAGANYTVAEEGIVYTPVGTLSAALTADPATVASLTVACNDPQDLAANSTADTLKGAGLFLVGNELLSYEGFANAAGVLTLTNVRRGLLDTVPAIHANGAGVSFLSGDNVVDDFFADTASLRVKALTKTFNSTLTLDAAPYDSITLNRRTTRPLHPVNIKWNGGGVFVPPASAVGTQTVTWANRSRLSLAVRSLTDNTNEYESGQQTIVRWRKNGGTWNVIAVAPGETTTTFNPGTVAGDSLDYEIYSTRDGYDSISKYAGTAGQASSSGATGGQAGAPPPTDGNGGYVEPSSAAYAVLPTGAALAKNDLVNVFSDGGTAKVRPANATTGLEAHGFVTQAYGVGDNATVHFDGLNDGMAGLTPGTKYLSDTAGKLRDTPPTGSGKIVQRVGVATAAGVFNFEPGDAIGLA